MTTRSDAESLLSNTSGPQDGQAGVLPELVQSHKHQAFHQDESGAPWCTPHGTKRALEPFAQICQLGHHCLSGRRWKAVAAAAAVFMAACPDGCDSTMNTCFETRLTNEVVLLVAWMVWKQGGPGFTH